MFHLNFLSVRVLKTPDIEKTTGLQAMWLLSALEHLRPSCMLPQTGPPRR